MNFIPAKPRQRKNWNRKKSTGEELKVWLVYSKRQLKIKIIRFSQEQVEKKSAKI